MSRAFLKYFVTNILVNILVELNNKKERPFGRSQLNNSNDFYKGILILVQLNVSDIENTLLDTFGRTNIKIFLYFYYCF